MAAWSLTEIKVMRVKWSQVNILYCTNCFTVLKEINITGLDLHFEWSQEYVLLCSTVKWSWTEMKAIHVSWSRGILQRGKSFWEKSEVYVSWSIPVNAVHFIVFRDLLSVTKMKKNCMQVYGEEHVYIHNKYWYHIYMYYVEHFFFFLNLLLFSLCW